MVVDDLRVGFDTTQGRIQAVDGVSLELRTGDTIGVVGESGSGKTVLSRTMMGLIRDGSRTHVSGSVHLSGVDLTGLPAAELRRVWGTRLAMVFQDPMTSLNPTKRIGIQITESLRYHLQLSRSEARTRAVDLLESVGIADAGRRIDQYPHELSGGMRQRVTIAIALSCSPDLLFADEPTTALDVTVQAQILDLLAQQQRDRNMSMVLVTHDLGVVRGRTDHIIVMYAGQVVESAPTPTIFAMPRMPYTEGLMNAVPQITGPIHVTLRAIPGRPPNLVDLGPGCRFSPRCPYAQDRCLEEAPPLRPEPTDPDHLAACWYPVGTPENIEARELNRQRGRTAAGTPIDDEILAEVPR